MGTEIKPYQAYVGFVRKLALRLRREAQAQGLHSVQLDDIEQEIAVTWCRARETFDPTKGVQFETYFWRAAMTNVRRWLKLGDAKQRNIAPVSLDAPLSADEGAASLHELIPDTGESIAATLEKADYAGQVIALMKPLTRAFIELLMDPPPDLYAQVAALQAHAGQARVLGEARTAPTQVTTGVIFDMMGLNAPQRRQVIEDIKDAPRRFRQKLLSRRVA